MKRSPLPVMMLWSASHARIRAVKAPGTVSNAQYAASMGLSAIAVSADANTTADNALSAEAAQLVLKLIKVLQDHAHHSALLPRGVALNVNYPKFTAGQSTGLQWARRSVERGLKGLFSR